MDGYFQSTKSPSTFLYKDILQYKYEYKYTGNSFNILFHNFIFILMITSIQH